MKANEIFGKIRARGLTLEKLAKMVGVNHQTLSRRIRGVRPMYVEDVKAIGDALELSDDEIIDWFIR